MNAQSNYIFSTASILEEYLNHSQAYTMELFCKVVNPLSANPTKWSNTLKQFVGNFAQLVINKNSKNIYSCCSEFRGCVRPLRTPPKSVAVKGYALV